MGLGFALLVAEIGLRLMGVAYPAFYRVDAARGYGLRPGAEGWWTREGRGWVRINQAGFRHAELRPGPAAPGNLRIAVLGDSFTEALQVDEAVTWERQLQNRLQASAHCRVRRGLGGAVEVLNFGVGGYGTGQELLTWRHLARFYRPQLVLLALYPGNDFTDNSPDPQPDRPVFRLGPDGRLEQDDAFRRTAAYRWRTSLPGQWLDALMNHSRVLQLANESKNRFAALQQLRSKAGAGPASAAAIPFTRPASESAWAVTAALLTALDQEVRADGARLLVVSVSSPDQVWPKRAERPADPFAQERRLGGLLQARSIPYLSLGPTLQLEVDRHGLLLHGFAGQEPGHGHWNPEGHRLAAAAMADWLCRP
jgi:lysophospholipase L1-like esterase